MANRINYILSSNNTYKKYVALLTQTGTTAPTDIVLESTFTTNPTWTYAAPGQYYIDNISFDMSKTFYTIGGNPTGNPNYRIGLTFDRAYNRIFVNTINFNSSSYSDDYLDNTSIEIRIYN